MIGDEDERRSNQSDRKKNVKRIPFHYWLLLCDIFSSNGMSHRETTLGV